jgi:hypothetical protein
LACKEAKPKENARAVRASANERMAYFLLDSQTSLI